MINNCATINLILAFFSLGAIFLAGTVPDHNGGRPMEVNACILITHMVYL
jgi:hypothetical protein